MDSDDPEFREWAEKKIAEILSLEEKERAAAESPPDELKGISDIVDHEVMPVMEAFGVPITREELSKMIVEWYVRRRPPPIQEVAPCLATSDGPGGPGLPPARIGRRAAPFVRPFFRIAKVNTLGGLLRRGLKGALIVVMLVPIVLVPAYFFISTLPPPQLGFNPGSSQPGGGLAPANVALTLTPSSPLIAPGQTQNYSLLTLSPTGGGTAAPMTLTAFSPEGLSFELSQTNVPSLQDKASIPIAIRASSSVTLGSHYVTVEERIGTSAWNETFTVVVVPALVVMESLSFVPQSLNVTAGTTVYWMNLDSTIGCCDPGYHNAVFGDGVNASSPVLKRLGTWDYTFETPGDYFYMCSIHPWMAGEVRVTG